MKMKNDSKNKIVKYQIRFFVQSVEKGITIDLESLILMMLN